MCACVCVCGNSVKVCVFLKSLPVSVYASFSQPTDEKAQRQFCLSLNPSCEIGDGTLPSHVCFLVMTEGSGPGQPGGTCW